MIDCRKLVPSDNAIKTERLIDKKKLLGVDL